MTLALDDGDVRIYQGDVIECLREIDDGIAQTCVTSPPYWGLRDYGNDGQIGLETTPDEYVDRLVDVFREVRRVLRDDGTLWLNLGDSYAGAGYGNHDINGEAWKSEATLDKRSSRQQTLKRACQAAGIKPKDLVGIPWRVAFALQADGWYLRSDIIWSKPNPMPESVTDRPTKSHEYVFLLSKSARYYYDADAIRESDSGRPSGNTERKIANGTVGARPADHLGSSVPWKPDGAGRNARSVWRIVTKPYADAHFAVFPPELPERCIKAATRLGDTVVDPFMGSGTTAYVARHLGRKAIGTELNADYITIARKRLQQLSLLRDAA
jgi:DNA modification methylase